MAGANGVIIIRTELDSKNLEAQLKDEEKKLKTYEKQNEILINAKVKIEKSKEMREYQQAKELIKKSYADKIEASYYGTDKEADERTRQKYIQKQNNNIQALNEAYSEQFSKIEDINKQLEENEKHQKLIKGNIETINEELIKTKGYEKIENSLGKISTKIEGVIKKVGRWALAIFGIRGIYMAIRNAINVIAQDDQQLKADIDYIKAALAYSLEPIVRVIIDLVKQLLQYLAYIIQSWTGKNIFENANKALKKSVGTAKELKKQLAGFDELNILQDNSSSGGGAPNPSIDLSKISGKQPWWVEMLADPSNLPGLAGLLAFLTQAPKLISKFGLKLGLLKGLGIGVAVAGIVKSVQSLLKYLEEPTWENFGGILEGLGTTILGIGIYTGNLPLIVAGAIMVILGAVASLWDDIKKFLTNLKTEVFNVGEDIKNWLHDNLGIIGDFIGVFIDGFVSAIKGAVDVAIGVFEYWFTKIKGFVDGLILIFKGKFGEGLKTIFRGIINSMISALNTLINGINIILTPLRGIIMVAGNILGADWTMDDVRIPNIPKLARGGIVHNPGPGVMMGNYIAGEGASPEAVLPLDDNTMDRLGESIARHMTINANIYNTMNGRVISRELKRINSENEFAYNR